MFRPEGDLTYVIKLVQARGDHAVHVFDALRLCDAMAARWLHLVWPLVPGREATGRRQREPVWQCRGATQAEEGE